jgi:transcriptional regulator with XRE-family HTH domain
MGIRDRRKALKLSQQELAAQADCSIASMRLYEGGWTPTTGASPVLKRILDVLTVAELDLEGRVADDKRDEMVDRFSDEGEMAS